MRWNEQLMKTFKYEHLVWVSIQSIIEKTFGKLVRPR